MRYVGRRNLRMAVEVLEKGGILGVPTETVYGLAVRADNLPAVEKLLKLKERDAKSGKRLTMMVAEVDEMRAYASMTPDQLRFARHYFPAELTVILPKKASFRHAYFDQFDTIGIRIPEHKYMLSLLRKTGPLLVTSANPRGEKPCQTGTEAGLRLPSIDGVVEGDAGGNLPSTVIDLTGPTPLVRRQGGLLVVHY